MWLFLTETGFVGFVLSLFGLVWRGMNREGKLQRSAAAWMIAAALFFALWALALARVPLPPP